MRNLGSDQEYKFREYFSSDIHDIKLQKDLYFSPFFLSHTDSPVLQV
jgi:hypothetical protein